MAVVCQAGKFVSLKIPFEPNVSTGFLQYYIHNLWLDMKHTFTYLENTMAYIKKGVDHKQVAAKILKILRKHHLLLEAEKFEFSKSKVKDFWLVRSHDQV